MLVYRNFRASSGVILPWKLNLDTLNATDIDALACIINDHVTFSSVVLPRTSSAFLRDLAETLRSFKMWQNKPVMLLDDVWTTGATLNKLYAACYTPTQQVVGVVIFARGATPDWVWSVFRTYEVT